MHEPVEVVLYTRHDCPLCDKAKASIRAAETLYRLRIRMREVDIDEDPALLEMFTEDVPVVYVNGREAFRHRVSPDELAAFLKVPPGDVGSARAPVHSLAAEKCVPCRGGVPPLQGDDLAALSRELGDGWRVIGEHHLEKEFTLPDFAAALALTNRIGAVAEREGHHPDIFLAWGRVRVTIWTHKVDGLTRNDFVLAAKIDRVAGEP